MYRLSQFGGTSGLGFSASSIPFLRYLYAIATHVILRSAVSISIRLSKLIYGLMTSLQCFYISLAELVCCFLSFHTRILIPLFNFEIFAIAFNS